MEPGRVPDPHFNYYFTFSKRAESKMQISKFFGTKVNIFRPWSANPGQALDSVDRRKTAAGNRPTAIQP